MPYIITDILNENPLFKPNRNPSILFFFNLWYNVSLKLFIISSWIFNIFIVRILVNISCKSLLSASVYFNSMFFRLLSSLLQHTKTKVWSNDVSDLFFIIVRQEWKFKYIGRSMPVTFRELHGTEDTFEYSTI